MASIKEEVMTVKDDCQYVRALDANGNSIRISKEDLAKVLGGLRLKELAKNADWNTITETGYYITSGYLTSYQHAPKAYHYGLLIVFARSTTEVFQIYLPDRSPGMIYTRDYYASSWKGWSGYSGTAVEYGAHT